ncbi:MAG TPA: hypothetical protein VET65_00775 [Candidatus Limnocylindrales bacterium]|nr:hypothetical protein [Candidatus Limnocylindrales bacterium]
MILPLLGFVLGLLLSLLASEVLVTALGRLGGRLRLSAGLLGLLVALGADSPEISSSVTATLAGARDVGVGVILGSNLFNLAALLGLSAVIAGRLRFHRALLTLDGGVAVATTAIVALMLFTGLPPIAGVILMAVVFVPYAFLLAARPQALTRLPMPARVNRRIAAVSRLVHGEPAPTEPGRSVKFAWWIPPAIAAIVLGSYLMVTAALTLGDRWQVSRAVLGTVVLAALTSLPNAYAAVRLAQRRNGPAVLSEAFNSNTLNLLAGISLPALVLGGLQNTRAAGSSLAWLLGMTLVAIALGYPRHDLSRRAGLLLIGIYAAFLVFAVR